MFLKVFFLFSIKHNVEINYDVRMHEVNILNGFYSSYSAFLFNGR